MNAIWKPDKRVLFLLTILVPIGIGTKFYDGFAKFWVNNSLSDVVYVIFWSLVLFTLRPTSSPFKICCVVFLLSAFIEISQLWSFPLIEKLRTGFIGKSLFGNRFVYSDFLYYFLGSLGSFYLIKYFQNSIAEKHEK